MKCFHRAILVLVVLIHTVLAKVYFLVRLGALFAFIFECLALFWLRAAHIPQLDRSGKKGIKRQKRKNQMIGCSYGVFTLCALFLIAFIAIYFGTWLFNNLVTKCCQLLKLIRMKDNWNRLEMIPTQQKWNLQQET